MQKGNSYTVGQWCDRWFRVNQSRWNGSTVGGYRNLIYRHILPGIGSIPLEELTENTVASFYDSLRSQGLSTRSVWCVHLLLRRCMDDAARDQLIPCNPVRLCKEPKTEEYTDEDYFDDAPRFRPMRVILAILSLAGFGYLIYRGFVTGLADTTGGSTISSGMTYIIVSLCMLVSALLYFIMLNRNTVFAFLLPMLFYLGGGVFAFLQKGDDMQLLFAAIAGAVLAVISLILAITSRGGYDDEEEDYDDAFEDDYADDAPQTVINSVQVHFFLPRNRPFTAMKKKIRNALFEAGFTFPEITVRREDEERTRHIIFECDIEEE